ADPGQAITSLTTEALKNIITGSKLVVVNDYEWELVKQKTGWDESSILDKAGALIITLGQRGSKLLTTTDQFEITAYQADQVIDPTGAGDAYRAGLLYGLKNKFSLKNSAYIGAWLASKAVGARGTQNHTIHKT
ncbi:MAG TPA: PfkB family carbohydrate kinase, partial [Patescibacteria group bacterium]